MSVGATPRSLMRSVQKDLSPGNSEPRYAARRPVEAKDLMRAFLSADDVISKEHSKILDNPAFAGCYPKIVDKVFSLERFASELPRQKQESMSPKPRRSIQNQNQRPVNSDPNEDYNPGGLSTFEHSLVCINITLTIGIVLTLVIFGLFFLFLNNALYLKEQIS